MDMKKQQDFLMRISTEEEFARIQKNETAIEVCTKMFDEAYIDSVEVFSFNDKRFVVAKEDVPKLPETWTNMLEELSLDESLENPIYVGFDETGVLLID